MDFHLKLFLFATFLVVVSTKSLTLHDELTNYIDEEEDNDADEEYIDLSHLGSEAFGLPDENVGQLVESWNESSNMNPEELGSYYEGDILIEAGEGRSAVRDKALLWPGGVIPYEIEPVFRKSMKNS